MGIKPFKLDQLHTLDMGKISIAMNRELEKVARDMIDRPGEGAARSVTLRINLKPAPNELGNCDSCTVEFQVASAMPPRRSKEYSMAVAGNGMLTFNDESPDNVHQRTIDQAETKEIRKP